MKSEKIEGALACFIVLMMLIWAAVVAGGLKEVAIAESCDTLRGFVHNDVRYTCERVEG